MKCMLLNLPNPPGRNIYREYAGGFGVSGPWSSSTLLPIYLLYAATAARQTGWEYDILDAQAMKYDSAKVISEVKKSGCTLLISLVSLPSMQQDTELLAAIKQTNPHVFIIVLGAVCNVMPEEVLSRSGVDLVLNATYPYYRRLAEVLSILRDNPPERNALTQIAGGSYLVDGTPVHNKTENYSEELNQLDFNVYQQLPLHRYMISVPDVKWVFHKCISVVTGVGCPYGCFYCPYPIGYGRTIVNKSISKIIDELEYLKTKFGITEFLFREQNFTYRSDRVLSLCNEIIARKLDIKWYVEARVDQVSEEMLGIMKVAGCFRIHYGVETGSTELITRLGKPRVQIGQVKRAFELARKLGIATTAFMIIGLPGETRETLRASVRLLREINPDNVHINVVTPYPGTNLYKMAISKGWLICNDWSKFTEHTAVMTSGEFSIHDLSSARKMMWNEFRNYKLRHDRYFRSAYLKSLPSAVWGRLASILGNTPQLVWNNRSHKRGVSNKGGAKRYI